MKGNRTNRTVRHDVRDNCGDCVVRGIRFDHSQKSGVEVREDWSLGKSGFESVERGRAVVREIPSRGLLGEAGERNADVGIAVDEATIEVSETEEGLDVLDVARDGPVEDLLDLLVVHANTFPTDDVAEIFQILA